MKLVSVYDTPAYVQLYELLAERTPEESISHKAMPTFAEHCKFVDSKPYAHWYLIVGDFRAGDENFGACYLSKQREIGVFVYKKHRGHGIGRWAVRTMMRRHAPGQFLANISPLNPDSHKLFEGLGFKTIQHTLAMGST